MKLKNAPNMKFQDKNAPLEELFIIAGSQAYDKERWEIISLLTQCDPNKKPVILNSERLSEIDRLRIAPENRKYIRIFKSGNLSEEQKNAICLNLAKYTKAEQVLFADEALQNENASDYIARIRKGESTTAEMMAEHRKRGKVTLDLSQEKPTTPELVEAFLNWQIEPLRRDTNLGTIHKLKDGAVWEFLNDEDFKRDILAFLKAVHCPNYTVSTISKLADLAVLEMERLPHSNPDLIGFKNGVLNKKTGEFLPHSPDHFLRMVENFDLHTESLETPLFDDWLTFVANGNQERLQAILAGLYMVLTNRHQWGLFIEASGKAGAGKSVFGEIATILNGRNNTAVVDIKGLDEPRMIADLIGKTLAYSPDQERYTGTADGLKKLTGGDMLKGQILYKGFIDFTPTAVFMMVSNYATTFTDRNGGIARRRVIIPFERPIPKEKKDVDFIDKIKGEIYGITNKLLAYFPQPETARKILENHQSSKDGDSTKQEANHLIDFATAFKFIDSCSQGLQWGSNNANSKATIDNGLYKAYLHYCDCMGLRNPMNLNAFKQSFQDAINEAGEQGELIQLKINGYPKINIQWKDREATLKEWRS